jgi:hypothetical protein
MPFVAKGPDGRPLASPEVYVLVSLDRLDGGDALVVARGVSPEAFAVRKNLEIIATSDRDDFTVNVQERSADADLVVVGFTEKELAQGGGKIFLELPKLRDVLFVSAQQKILIE